MMLDVTIHFNGKKQHAQQKKVFQILKSHEGE